MNGKLLLAIKHPTPQCKQVLTRHQPKEVVFMKTILTSASIALVLSASLAATSLLAAADRGVGGDETNADRVVPSANAWTILTAEPFQTMNDITHCVSTGSADAQNPNMGNSNLYRFTFVHRHDKPGRRWRLRTHRGI